MKFTSIAKVQPVLLTQVSPVYDMLLVINLLKTQQYFPSHDKHVSKGLMQ